MPIPSYSIGDQYLDSLTERHGREPSLDRDLRRAHTDALKLYEDAATKLTATEAKAALAKLASMEKLYADVAKARADVAETRASSSRVTSQNFQRAIEAAEKVNQELTMHEGVDTPQHEEAMRAFSAPGNITPAVAYADTLTKSFDYYGKRLSPDNPNIDIIMSRAAGQLIGGPLVRENRDRLIQAVAGSSQSPTLIADWTRLVDAGLRRREDMAGLKAQNTQDLEALKSGKAEYESQYDKLEAGAPGSPQLEADLQSITDELGPRLMKVLGRTEADIAAERQLLVTENEQLKYLKEQADYYGGLVKRGEAADPIARLIGDPGFRQWAEGNGMRLGQVVTDPATGKLRYTPSADDGRAIALYRWQTAHPGRYSPIRGLKSTGARVRVTFEDPQKREDILKRFGADGQFFLRNGALVSPAEARAELAKGGFIPTVEAATVGDKMYLKKSDGTVIDAETGAAATPPQEAKFEPAVLYTDGKVSRYLMDVDLADPAKVAAAFAGTDTAMQIAPQSALDGTEKTTLQQVADTAPIKVVDESKVRSTWTNVVEGKLDARHASDYVDPSRGPDTISLDGGAVVIPGSVPATIEVREVPRRFALGDVARGWRRRMSEEAARRLDQQDIERGVVRLGEQERLEYAKQAQAQLAGAPAPEPGVAPKVQIPITTSGGTEGTLTTIPGSTPARVAEAEGRPVVPVETAVVRTQDGETYELTMGAAAPVAVKVEADGTRTPVEVNADFQAKLEGAERVPSPAPATGAAPTAAGAPPVAGVAVPGVSGIQVPAAEGPKVTFAQGAPQAIIDGAAVRPSIGEAIGRGAAGAMTAVGRGAKAAAEALLPGGGPSTGAPPTTTTAGAPGAEPGAPGEKEPSVIDKLRRRREAAKQAKAAAASEADVRRAVAEADTSGFGATDIGGIADRAGEGGLSEVAPTDMSPEALKRGSDAALLGLLRQTRGGSPNFDLAMRAEALERKRVEAEKAADRARRTGEVAPPFDATAYAAEARKIADEARERMRTRRGADLSPFEPTPGKGAPLPEQATLSTGTEAPTLTPESETAPASAPAPAPAPARPAATKVTPESVRVGTPGRGSVAGLMKPEREPAFTPPRPRMTEEDRKALDEKLKEAIARPGVIAPPKPKASAPGTEPVPAKPEVTPTGAPPDTSMREVIRTTSPTTVQQYMQNVGDAQKKGPSTFRRLMRRAFGKEEPTPATATEEAP